MTFDIPESIILCITRLAFLLTLSRYFEINCNSQLFQPKSNYEMLLTHLGYEGKKDLQTPSLEILLCVCVNVCACFSPFMNVSICFSINLLALFCSTLFPYMPLKFATLEDVNTSLIFGLFRKFSSVSLTITFPSHFIF